ncbi:MAG: MBOAT family protein [Flavobacteriales bacterium]|nr:MBOAT family protein [Flavobacteriales bacterium]
MLFTSLEFLALFVLAFAAYWLLMGRSARRQNLLLLLASLVFYGWADLRFLALLAASATLNFLLGRAIAGATEERWRSLLLYCGLALNLGILGFFKYFDFFYASIVDLVNLFGAHAAYDPLNLLLPLGISFFTFSSVGYLIDVRNEEIEPCRDPLAFFTWTFFFPKMLAGPIDRAQHFLPQLAVARVFDRARATDACRQVLWGLFAKVAIADNISRVLNPVLAEPEELHGSTLLLCAYLYLIQLYADFSGYSNIALGVSRLLGLDIARNFNVPLFATGIADFWRRWHISLSSWMMDYLYTPLSFVLRNKGRLGAVLAISITFLAVGVWHGANWNFVVFGTLQSLYFLPVVLWGAGLGRGGAKDAGGGFIPFLRMVGLFALLGPTFMLLRAADMHQAWGIYGRIFSPSLFDPIGDALRDPRSTLGLIAFFLLVEWIARKRMHALEQLGLGWPPPLRWGFYWAMGVSIFLLAHHSIEFIYFQF